MKFPQQRIPLPLTQLITALTTGLMSGLTVSADAANTKLNFTANVDDSTIEINGDNNLAVKAGYITLSDLSSSATGLTYTNTTGEFSLTTGYVIPTTTEESNWNSAYGWGDHSSVGYCKWLGVQTSDPVGQNGAMYYNSSTSKVRLFEGINWIDLN